MKIVLFDVSSVGLGMGSFSQLYFHVVFSTKYRRKLLSEDVHKRLHGFIAGVVRNFGGQLIEAGGVRDHIHLLLALSPNRSVSDTVREIKSNASRWLNKAGISKFPFSWQTGYGAFTVSQSQIPVVKHYIQNQAEHHRTLTFEQEFVQLLQRHGIDFDKAHLFESELAD